MHPYITKWLSVIDGMNNENTYKLAWGRALVELCHVLEPQDTSLVIHYDQISEYFLKTIGIKRISLN